MGVGRSVAVWIFLLATLESATCQVAVRGFIGEDAVLPCIYSDVNALPDQVSVFWRDKDGGIVLDIIRNLENRTSQNEKFRGRVFSFPDEYRKGNFSVVMKHLLQTDGGLYECRFQGLFSWTKVSLTVSGDRDVRGSSTPSQRGAAVTSSLHVVVLSAALLYHWV